MPKKNHVKNSMTRTNTEFELAFLDASDNALDSTGTKAPGTIHTLRVLDEIPYPKKNFAKLYIRTTRSTPPDPEVALNVKTGDADGYALTHYYYPKTLTEEGIVKDLHIYTFHMEPLGEGEFDSTQPGDIDVKDPPVPPPTP